MSLSPPRQPGLLLGFTLCLWFLAAWLECVQMWFSLNLSFLGLVVRLLFGSAVTKLSLTLDLRSLSHWPFLLYFGCVSFSPGTLSTFSSCPVCLLGFSPLFFILSISPCFTLYFLLSCIPVYQSFLQVCLICF